MLGLLKVELDIRTASLSLARSMEQQLLASGYQLASAVRQPLAAAEQELSSLEESWQKRQQQLQQALEQQVGPRPAPAYPTLRTSTALVKASRTNSPGERGFSTSDDGFKDKRGVGNITQKPNLFISNMVKENKSKGGLIHR